LFEFLKCDRNYKRIYILYKFLNISNMGASLVYLDKPNKEIKYDVGENEHLKYVAGEMQGWRINMVSNWV